MFALHRDLLDQLDLRDHQDPAVLGWVTDQDNVPRGCYDNGVHVQGEQGAQGAKGNKGPTGGKGPAGPPGAPGRSGLPSQQVIHFVEWTNTINSW